MSPTRLLLLAAVLTACGPPSQHNQTRYGVRTVGFGPSVSPGTTLVWRADQLAELRVALHSLDALGPSFLEAPEGTAAIVVRPFDSGPGCLAGAARWTLGTTYVEIDPVCTRGYLELRAAMQHEVGHAIGLGHVCMTTGEVYDCSSVGFGPAVMNPSLSYGDPVDPSRFNGVGTDVPTYLDIAEYNRTHPGR